MSGHAEEWRPVPDWEDFYSVSSRGSVLRTKPGPGTPGGLLHPSPDSGGYPGVTLRGNGIAADRRVHELVAEAFIGPRPPGQLVRHLNDVKTDNRWPENLAYGTESDNKLDAVRNGHNRNTAIEECPAGHRYEGRNLIIAKRGNGRTFRQCRTCLYKRQGRNPPRLEEAA